MVYDNANGDLSRRRVRVVRWFLASNGCTYLRAWCYLRGEERTFRADRIQSWEPLDAEVRARQPDAVAPRHAAAPPTHSLPHHAPPRASAGASVGKIIFWIVGMAIASALFSRLPQSEPPAPHLAPLAVAPVVTPVTKPVMPAPAQPEAPAVAHESPRQAAFTRATGIRSARLDALYESADLDGNDSIDLEEVSAFQWKLYQSYRYLRNDTALRPNEFLAAGGGDCDDWVLVTAGLLRYWGISSWLACFGPDPDSGHAVCLVRMSHPPAGFATVTIAPDTVCNGVAVPAGTYIPIDYDKVGAFTNATKEGWELREMLVPEEAYGLPM
jgi:hypothetical protein